MTVLDMTPAALPAEVRTLLDAMAARREAKGEAFALGRAPRRHRIEQRPRLRRQRGAGHVEHGHHAAPIRDRTRPARRR